MLIQFWILTTGLTALMLLQLGSPRWRRIGSFVGLSGQPAWVWYAIESRASGILVVTLAYTLVWIVGCMRGVREGGS